MKRGTWYLVAGTAEGQRTFRVDWVASVEPTGQPAARPADFDLREAWQRIVTATPVADLAATLIGSPLGPARG